jgi:acyl-coenzyme A thioesterase PaaI-like protein
MNHATLYFQDYMPVNSCFGCGGANTHGLRIRSYWDGDIAKCIWQPQPQHQGWHGLTCGGVIATVVDCHCIATSMATAIRNEGRSLDSEPRYLFATGSLNIRYLKPSPMAYPLELHAKVSAVKDQRKYTMQCDVHVNGEKTADAQAITLLVYRSDRPEESAEAFRAHVK